MELKEFILYEGNEIINNYFGKYFPLVLLILSLALLYFFKNKIQLDKTLDKRIRSCIVVINGSLTIAYYLSRWIFNGISLNNMPLHLCYICNIISIILLINKNKRLYNFLIFIGVISGLSSLISVDLTISYKHFKYYYFLISHITIVIVPLYFKFIYNYSIKRTEIINSFIILQVLGIVMGVINKSFKTNYFFVSFTSNLAARGTILESLGTGKSYFINLEILIFIYLIIFIFFNNYTKIRRKNGQIVFNVYNIR